MIETVLGELYGIDINCDLIDKPGLERRLADIIVELDARDRFILSLYYNDGLTIEEIRQVLDMEKHELYSTMDFIAVNLKKRLIDDYVLATHGFY